MDAKGLSDRDLRTLAKVLVRSAGKDFGNIARLVGVSPGTVQHWVYTSAIPQTEFALRIISALGKTVTPIDFRATSR